MDFFLKNLIKDVLTNNPEDPFVYASHYFRKIKLCQHIISKDLKFIRESQYNRASFIVCLRSAFCGFTSAAEMTIFELNSFICVMFTGFSVHYVELFATVLDPTQRHENPNFNKYNLFQLLKALYFTVLYENWLNELSTFTDTKSDRKMINLRDLLQWVKTSSANYNLSYNTAVPDKKFIIPLIEEFIDIYDNNISSRESSDGNGPNAYGYGENEMSFQKIKRSFFLNNLLQNEIISKLPLGHQPPNTTSSPSFSTSSTATTAAAVIASSPVNVVVSTDEGEEDNDDEIIKPPRAMDYYHGRGGDDGGDDDGVGGNGGAGDGDDYADTM
jgi:hypothetical protein